MKLLKALLVAALVLAAIGGAGFGAGYLTSSHDTRTAAVHGVLHGTPHARADAQPTPPPPTSTPPASSPASGTPSPSSAPTTSGPAPATHTATAPPALLAHGDTGTRVRNLQARLFQLAWLPETTTGTYDAATVAAVRGFQDKRGLPPTGRLDRPTWHRLLAMTERPGHDAMFNVLHPGTTIYGPGAHGTDVRALQARLKDLDWYVGDVTGSYDHPTVAAVKGFQAKRGIPVTGKVDQRTLDRLNAMTTAPTHDAMYNLQPSPGALDARCLHGRVMCIDKTSRTLRWVVDGKVLLTLDARFGSTLNNTPTREGLFHVFLKDADHVSTLYGSAMPFSMFFSGGEAVHYSSDFATYGYAGASHGCVNIRDYNGIKWLYSQVRVGDKVVVYWS